MKNEEKIEAPSASPKEEPEEIVTPEPQPSQEEPVEQDPVKKELEKVGNKKKFTKRERLNFEKKKIEEQLTEIDQDEGIEPPIPEDDSTPVTVGMIKKMQKEQSKKTALELAEEISDEDEKKLTIHYLETSIVASGNPAEDLKKARAIVNSFKNAQIAEEAGRKTTAKGKGTPPGAPGQTEKVFQPTADERIFMQPPYNMTTEDVLKARKEAQANPSQAGTN